MLQKQEVEIIYDNTDRSAAFRQAKLERGNIIAIELLAEGGMVLMGN